MSKLRTLIHLCLEQQSTPEALLGLEEFSPLPKQFRLTETRERSCYDGAVHERFPKLMELYTALAGPGGIADLAQLYADMHGEKRKLQESIEGEEMHSFLALYETGISLSWWLFNLGAPIHSKPQLAIWPAKMGLRDYTRSVRFKHDWSDLEANWLITQTHDPGETRLTHKVISRVVTGLPRMRLFPEMPKILDVYNRLVAAVDSFVFPDPCEEWMQDALMILKASHWRCCVLLLVRQGSVSHWQVVQQQPRRKSERLGYIVNLLLDLYGEQEGLCYYLRVLNEEAKAQGFSSLADVVRGAAWNISSETEKAI